MPIQEVCSPVTRKGSKVASGQPMSPGARSNPSKGDSVPAQPTRGRVSTGQEPDPSPPPPQPRDDSIRTDSVSSGRSVFFTPGNDFTNFPGSDPQAQFHKSGERKGLWARLKIFG
jgi:hypothetical protein